MQYTAKLPLKLSWFNERSQSISQPRPWQSAHLEIANIPTHYPWQDLRLFTQTLSAQPTPLYLKKKLNKTFHLHADWSAAEPGIHTLRLFLHKPAYKHLLWETHFFLTAPPLTESLWLSMLQETYHQSHLRFRPQTPVPFTPVRSLPASTPDMAHEFYVLFDLLCGPHNLHQTLPLLPFEEGLRWRPLYRTRRISPALLFRNPHKLPLHTAVPEQEKFPQTPLAGYLNFLVQALISRLQHLVYVLPQTRQHTPFLVDPLQNMWHRGNHLWHMWQQHAYAQTPPQWSPKALEELRMEAHQCPALTPWLTCAQRLLLNIRPEHAPDALFVGYQNFAYVYQQWCTLQLKQALQSTLQSRGWQLLEALHPQRLSWRHTATGQYLVLAVEQRFSPLSQNSPAVFSISRGQQPDVCLLLFQNAQQRQQDVPHKGLVFEIKFRQDALRPRKVDLDRLHAYRDAVYTRQGEHARPLFTGGALLYPGHNENYPPGLQALTCLPTYELRLEYLLSQLLGAAL